MKLRTATVALQIVSCALSCLGSVVADKADESAAAIRVTCLDSDNKPLSGVPIMVVSSQMQRAVGATGKDGQILLNLDDTSGGVILASVDRFEIGLAGVPEDQQQHMADLLNKYVFEDWNWIVPAAATTEHGVTIRFSKAVDARVRFVTPEGVAADGDVTVVGASTNYSLAHKDGLLSVKIRDAASARFEVCDALDTIRFVDVAVPPPKNGVRQCGEIVVPSVPQELDARLELTAENLPDKLRCTAFGLETGVTLLHEGGRYGVGLPFGDPLEEAIVFPANAGERAVHAGKYFVVPGRPSENQLVRTVAGELLAGRISRVIEAGIPLIDIAPGAKLVSTVNIAECVDKCERLAGVRP